MRAMDMSLGGQARTYPPLGAADAADQLFLAQLVEQLLQIRHGDPLPLGDVRQIDGLLLLVQSQIQHGGDRVASFGVEFHGAGRIHS